jgi:hypothetical protein
MIKVIRDTAEKFRAECWNCFALLEYDLSDIDPYTGAITCPCCEAWITHKAHGQPAYKMLLADEVAGSMSKRGGNFYCSYGERKDNDKDN